MMNLRTTAAALGGDVTGGKVLAPGPGHTKRDRSLVITLDANGPDGFWVYSFANDDWRDCRDYVKEKLGISFEPHQNLQSYSSRAANAQPVQPKAKDNLQLARKIWQKSQTATGSPVEDYLHGRGLKLPNETLSVLRYHPACPFDGEKVPAMVAAMVDIHSNEFRGIHRTRLNPKDKAMLGTFKGAVVKLSPDENVYSGIHIAEGIETSLAVMAMGFKPVWCCLNAIGIAKFPVISSIESLTIFADNDANQTGQNKAIECGARWQSAGKEVRIFATPESGTDFADWMVA